VALLGRVLNTFGTTFTQKISQMDFHNFFNFVCISHKVTFHVELHILGATHLLTMTKSLGGVHPILLWGKCCINSQIEFYAFNFAMPLQHIFPYTNSKLWPRLEWNSNLQHQMHLRPSFWRSCPLTRCGKCFKFYVKKGHISKTLCNKWKHHTIHPFCSCILCILVSFL